MSSRARLEGRRALPGRGGPRSALQAPVRSSGFRNAHSSVVRDTRAPSAHEQRATPSPSNLRDARGASAVARDDSRTSERKTVQLTVPEQASRGCGSSVEGRARGIGSPLRAEGGFADGTACRTIVQAILENASALLRTHRGRQHGAVVRAVVAGRTVAAARCEHRREHTAPSPPSDACGSRRHEAILARLLIERVRERALRACRGARRAA